MWVLFTNNTFTNTYIMWNFPLCSTISCFHWRMLSVLIAAPSICQWKKPLKNICGITLRVWNVSCETDPESVMKDDWLHPPLFCVLHFCHLCSPLTSLHAFQNRSPCICCCMIASEGNVFCFCPVWANEHGKGRNLLSGSLDYPCLIKKK